MIKQINFKGKIANLKDFMQELRKICKTNNIITINELTISFQKNKNKMKIKAKQILRFLKM